VSECGLSFRSEEERDRLIRIWKQLDLPQDQAVLSGSGSLIMQGIDRQRPMGDVDIFVATRIWFDMFKSGIPPRACRLCDGETFYVTDEGWYIECHECLAFDKCWSLWTKHPDDEVRRCDPPYLRANLEDIEVNVFSNWRLRSGGNLDVAKTIREAVLVDGIPCVPLERMLEWKREVGREKDLEDIKLIERTLHA
jgi:hypothetical protein